MSAHNRPTNFRPFALAAMIVVVGVFVLRAIDVFGAPAQAKSSGSSEEQHLARLIEPFVGSDRVRTSIQTLSDNQRIWLILIDGPVVADTSASPYSSVIQDVVNARGFNSETDQLQILQQPFAQNPLNALTPFQIAEFGGLGLVLLLLLAGSISNRGASSRDETLDDNRPALASLSSEPQADNDHAIQQAAAVASITPQRSAALIRRWMMEDQR